jgi:endogenous inhibitor of DNA gyrase (YacG/DUF329 family)
MQPTSDSSSSTEAEKCPKCGSKPPWGYRNPGPGHWLIECDCAGAVAYRQEEERKRQERIAREEEIKRERDAKCPSCGGDGYRHAMQGGEFCSVACTSCQFGYDWNMVRAVENHLVPGRFSTATIENIGPEIKAEWEKVSHSDGEGLIIHGGVGTGKTFLAVAILLDLLHHYDYRQLLFATMPDLLDRIRATYNGGERDDVLERALSVPVLVLDDLGTEKVSPWVLEKVYQIINRRYNEQLCTICTTNLAPSQLAKHIGERTVSRLMEMCRVVKLDGADRRVQR